MQTYTIIIEIVTHFSGKATAIIHLTEYPVNFCNSLEVLICLTAQIMAGNA